MTHDGEYLPVADILSVTNSTKLQTKFMCKLCHQHIVCLCIVFILMFAVMQGSRISVGHPHCNQLGYTFTDLSWCCEI